MESIFCISEILGTIEDASVEICAMADASYDRAQERVSVTVEAFARRISLSGESEIIKEPWLPASEHVAENLPRDQAVDFAKDVFHSWVRKVRGAIPAEVSLAV